MEARHYKPLNGEVLCQLCYQACRIPEGGSGSCRVRRNKGGKLYSMIYGLATGIHPDPIEKKPLYHFHPGTTVLSFGSFGCNFSCDFCQNWDISQRGCAPSRAQHVTVDEVVHLAERAGSSGVAWTYNEPTIWHEFTYDASVAVKEVGLYTCYVTNGYIQEAPLREIAPYLDAMNIDVKAFTEEFYERLPKARLKPVLRTAELAVELGIHVELTYLIIPDENDDVKEIKAFAEWAVEKLGADVPIHFSRFHGDYRMESRKGTPLETMEMAYSTSRKAGARFVYLGNIRTERGNTFCPECGQMLIDRRGFSIRTKRDACTRCGYRLVIPGI